MTSFPDTTRLVKKVFDIVATKKPDDPIEAVAALLYGESPTTCPEGLEEVLEKQCIIHLSPNLQPR